MAFTVIRYGRQGIVDKEMFDAEITAKDVARQTARSFLAMRRTRESARFVRQARRRSNRKGQSDPPKVNSRGTLYGNNQR